MGNVINGVDKEVMMPGLSLDKKGYPGFHPRRKVKDGLTIDYDVAIRLRDGVTIYTDVYRPAGIDEPLPALILWSAYGKHFRWAPQMRAQFTDNAKVSDYAPIEAQDPATWCPAGYAIVVPDPRGVNVSEGDATYWSPQEGDDIHDTIEWIVEQSWCTGKVGMAGASYYGIVQWFAGATRPPHLAALMPYDGMSDLYREIAFHGGIPNDNFVRFWNVQTRCSQGLTEDWMKAMEVHPFLDDYWLSKTPAVDKIEVPTYVMQAGATTPSTHAGPCRRSCGWEASRSGSKCTGVTSGRTCTRRKARRGKSPSSTATSRTYLTRSTPGRRFGWKCASVWMWARSGPRTNGLWLERNTGRSI